jgi:tetratricopeptide (TPR) repeat protein
MRAIVICAGLAAAVTVSACAPGSRHRKPFAPDACTRGYSAMQARAYARAIPHLNRCVAAPRLTPQARADAYHQRGRAHMKTGRHGKALADFRAAIRQAPTHAGAHNSAAWTHYLRGEHRRALRYARKARMMAPDNVRVVDTHAHILAALGRTGEAAAAFLRTCTALHSRDGLAKLQQHLKRAGFDPGPVTGTCTPATRRALAACARAKCRIWK